MPMFKFSEKEEKSKLKNISGIRNLFLKIEKEKLKEEKVKLDISPQFIENIYLPRTTSIRPAQLIKQSYVFNFILNQIEVMFILFVS